MDVENNSQSVKTFPNVVTLIGGTIIGQMSLGVTPLGQLSQYLSRKH